MVAPDHSVFPELDVDTGEDYEAVLAAREW